MFFLKLSASMRWLALILVLGAFPLLAQTGTGPLVASYYPSIDTNCAHSQYASNIWMSDWTVKLRQDSGSPASNACYITVYGTQNEFVDFQVHFHDTGSGTPNLNVTVSSFVQTRPSSYTISNATGIGENINVYREAYMHVSPTPTSYMPTFYGSTGYYPDMLIPTVDPYWGQTTSAWPFTVSANNNQSAWVDVLIPSAAPSGYYLGSVTVKSGSTTLATMPVVIGVWQWPTSSHMPSTSSLQTLTQTGFAYACDQFYNGYSNCGSYPGASTIGGGGSDAGVEQSNIDLGTLLLDHRYSGATPIYTSYQSLNTPGTEFTTYWGPLYNGTATHNMPTILSGAKELTIENPGGGSPNRTNTQNWATLVNNNGWYPSFFDYSCDEPPSGCAWSTITSNASILHSTTPETPALVTTNYASANSNNVLNAIDWMVVLINDMDQSPTWGGRGLQRSTYNAWLSGNCCGTGSPTRQLWSYLTCSSTGTCSNGTAGASNAGVTYPNYDIDGLPAANRVQEWLTFSHTQSGELYYDATYAWESGNDPVTNVYFFGGWGDGTLVYPGRQSGSAGGPENVGTTKPIFLPSIRLKLIRDGMQDYEYLNVLTNNGQSSTVQSEITSWITNSYTFETTGSGLNTARIDLGTAIHQLTYPAVLLPPPWLSGTLQ